MVNKKAWLRIVEATVCTLIILGVIITLYYNGKGGAQDNRNQDVRIILEELSNNDSMRYVVINSSLQNRVITQKEIDSFILNRIRNNDINITSRICDISESEVDCSLNTYVSNEKEIFVESLILSTYINNSKFNHTQTPKKIKLYYWEK